MTPKYALNAGLRSDRYRNTLARLFIRVDSEEMALFKASINDTHVRSQLAERIAGDPVTRQEERITAAGNVTQTVTRHANSGGTNGYLDFFIQQASMPLQEKFDVKETLADNYTAEFFGQQPPMWSYSGWLMNTVQDDQATNFLRLYLSVMRGTQLARRQKIIALKVDTMIVSGAMVNLNMTLTSNAEIYIPFSFSLLVKRINFVNYTQGWTPTRATSRFAADPHDIPYDGRPASEGSLRNLVASMGEDVVQLGPNGEVTSDPRTRRAPPRPDALSPAPTPVAETDEENSVFETALLAAGGVAAPFLPGGSGRLALGVTLGAPVAIATGIGLGGLVAADAVGLPGAGRILARIDDAISPTAPPRPPAPPAATPETQNPPHPTTPIPLSTPHTP